jgi:hypothetical protein
MRLILSALAVSLLVPTAANAAIGYGGRPIYGTGWDTTSATDYGLLQRGLTLGTGVVELSASLGYITVPYTDDWVDLQLNFSVGVTSEMEVGVETIFQLAPDGRWTQQIVPRIIYDVYSSRSVDVALSGFMVIDFDGDDPETLPLLQFGVPTRIKLGSGFALFVGQNLVTWGRLPDDYLSLDINVGLSKQLHSDLAVRFDTQIASLNITGPATTTSWGDIFPVGASLIYSAGKHIDLSAQGIYEFINDAPNVLGLKGSVFVRF